MLARAHLTPVMRNLLLLGRTAILPGLVLLSTSVKIVVATLLVLSRWHPGWVRERFQVFQVLLLLLYRLSPVFHLLRRFSSLQTFQNLFILIVNLLIPLLPLLIIQAEFLAQQTARVQIIMLCLVGTISRMMSDLELSWLSGAVPVRHQHKACLALNHVQSLLRVVYEWRPN